MTAYVPLAVLPDWAGALGELDNGTTFALHLAEASLGDDALLLTYEGRTRVSGTLVAIYTLPATALRKRHETPAVTMEEGDGMAANMRLRIGGIDWVPRVPVTGAE